MFVDFTKAFDSMHKEKKDEIVHGLDKETITTIMMLYKTRKQQFTHMMVKKKLFDIVTEILQGDTLSL